MAVAGNAKGAYRLRYEDDALTTTPTTAPGSLCAEPNDETVARILSGETVTVAGADVAKVRKMVLDAVWGGAQ